MTQPNENVQTIAAESMNLTLRLPSQQRPANASSATVSFDRIKHLLSNKPLRRPNRTAPLGR